MKKQVSFERLDEILSTVNTRVVKEIELIPHSTHIPTHFDFLDFKIGHITYELSLIDQDPYYADESVNFALRLLERYKDLPFVIKEPFKWHWKHFKGTGELSQEIIDAWNSKT